MSGGMPFSLGPKTDLILHAGGITKLDVEAIVEPVDETLLGNTSPIHRAAGAELAAACRAIREVRPGVRCPIGEVRLTPGFRLRARHVIHAAGPVYRSVAESGPLLAATYRSALRAANEQRCRSIAFPPISCSTAGGFPWGDAARIAIRTCRVNAGGLAEIHFVLASSDSFRDWLEAAERILR